MAKAAQKTEVAPANSQGTAVADVDADFMAQILADEGSGVSSMDMDDLAVPYLYVLQANSPQVNEDSPLYVKDARAGMFYNNVSNEVYDGREVGLTIIPCAYERKYVEWVDRDAGGGYVADHDIDSGILSETVPDERGRPRIKLNDGKFGNLIVETAYHYVFFKNTITGVWEQIIIPMKSSFLKKSRRFNKSLTSTLIPGTVKTAPRWLYPYNLKTTKETKDNNTWSNVEFVRLPDMVTPDQYRQAKKFAEDMSKGLVVRGKEINLGEAGSSEGGAGSKANKTIDQDGGDLPF